MGKQGRSTPEIQQAKKNSFLKAFSETGSISAAARSIGMDRRNHYDWKQKDPDYVERFKAAELVAAETLESELFRRALEGNRQYKFHQGEPIMVVCSPSHPDAVNLGTEEDPIWRRHYYESQFADTVGIFLLKGAKPEKYRERYDVRTEDGDIDNAIESGLAQLANREKAIAAGADPQPPSSNGNGAAS